jgi:2'-5' RNA ligase
VRGGNSAHVTLLFPFAHPNDLTNEISTWLAGYFAELRPFDAAFLSVAWFNDRVTHLERVPDQPFRAMTRDLRRAFPMNPPYGDRVAEPTPHLNLGEGSALELLKQAAPSVSRSLPEAIGATEAKLMIGGSGPNSWTVPEHFSFGPKCSIFLS